MLSLQLFNMYSDQKQIAPFCIDRHKFPNVFFDCLSGQQLQPPVHAEQSLQLPRALCHHHPLYITDTYLVSANATGRGGHLFIRVILAAADALNSTPKC